MTLEIFSQRASIRKFSDRKVEDEKLRQLCGIGAKAPSACNMQQWRFIIVTDPNVKGRLVEHGGAGLIADAPAGILVCYSRDTKNYIYQDHIQSASAAIQNILLAAPQLGLGACWICNLPRPAVIRKIFSMPKKFIPVAYVLVGYPQKPGTGPMPLKHDINDIVGLNTFPSMPDDGNYSCFRVWGLRLMVALYRYCPLWMKKHLLNRVVDRKLTKKFEQ